MNALLMPGAILCGCCGYHMQINWNGDVRREQEIACANSNCEEFEKKYSWAPQVVELKPHD